ncbi:tail protein [Pectobacterium phage Peat1]|uniref:Tail protein n=1 Tax=Pectobacterium phage Peat1 TaxID=1654601 RepID=A0A0H3YEH5_9CAUD|nr:tail spike protein [Pectobacterium phage Peat1]AKN21214.1 tail protein [Pectobacterium phage Peat1]
MSLVQLIDSTVGLRNELTQPDGAYLTGLGASTVGALLDTTRKLSYYGNNRQALIDLLLHAKVTGGPIDIDVPVLIDTPINMDFEYTPLIMSCSSGRLLSDTTALVLNRLGYGSTINNFDMWNVTAPWAITRWGSTGDWNTSEEAVASLRQTNDLHYYQPTVNDADVWSALTPEQQNQNISPKLEVHNSDGVVLNTPRGRYALYEFYGCNYCRVFNPNLSGGKGVLGTIVFNNTNATAYGIDNWVVGGDDIRNGSFSGVVHLRNKRGGAINCSPYRSGESGIKTYQNELNGVSARCYEMTYTNCHVKQACYDGLDLASDYGAETGRIDDTSLDDAPWHELPTKHTISNCSGTGCRGTALHIDGTGNSITGLKAGFSGLSGIYDDGVNNIYMNIISVNNALDNISHQITIPKRNIISSVTLILEASESVTYGYGLYSPLSAISDLDTSLIESGTVVPYIIKAQIATGGDLTVGHPAASDRTARLLLDPEYKSSAGFIGVIAARATGAPAGAPTGDVYINARYLGSEVPGFQVLGVNGGGGLVSTLNSAFATQVGNSQAAFVFDDHYLSIVARDAAGVLREYALTDVPL